MRIMYEIGKWVDKVLDLIRFWMEEYYWVVFELGVYEDWK